jgi:uncharacterized protein YfaT (DUF1175 family)
MKTNNKYTHHLNDEFSTLAEAISSVECNGYFVVINDEDTADVYFYDDEDPVRMIYKDEKSGRYVVGI